MLNHERRSTGAAKEKEAKHAARETGGKKGRSRRKARVQEEEEEEEEEEEDDTSCCVVRPISQVECQISQVTQGANCPIRSFLPVAWFLSDWHFPFPDPGIWALPLCLSVLPSYLAPLAHTAGR